MMRATTIAIVAAVVVCWPAGLWAQDGDQKANPSENAAAEEAEAPEGAEPQVKEFHLDFSDLKDLRDADIILPEIDDALIPDGGDKPDDAKPDEEPEKRIDPAKVVRQIVEGMDDSAVRLKKRKDPGEETQGVQKKVVDDLSDLIEYVKQQQQQQSQSQQQQNQQSQRDDQRAQQRRRQRQGRQQGRGQGRQQQQPQRGQEPMQDEFATKGAVQEEELEAVAKLMAERWGDLLKNPSRETLQSIPEMILPKYQRLLSRYFYALARRAAAEQGE